MRKFEFTAITASTFTGFSFYQTHKDSLFLRNPDNIHRILSQGHQLRQGLKDVQPGESLAVSGLYVKNGLLLSVKKGGPNVILEDHEFTANRLAGLTAAFVYEHRLNYPVMECTEAKILGLTWNSKDPLKAKLYLASVSGTEHFYEQFSFFPLICALRKMQMGKFNPKLVTKTAKIKNSSGENMVQLLLKNIQLTKTVWQLFPGTNYKDFTSILSKLEK